MKTRDDKIKALLDFALQRCQEFPYKDWDAENVASLIKHIKTILNTLPKDKPPLLSDETLCGFIEDEPLAGLNAGYYSLSQRVAQAQREVDIKFYG